MSVFQMANTMIYLPAERQGEPLQRESFAGSSGYGLREKRTARTGPSRTLQSDTPMLVRASGPSLHRKNSGLVISMYMTVDLIKKILREMDRR